MLIIFTFLLNACLNFLLGLLIAGILGPDSYGRFSVAFMAATVATTLIFDWLRLSATRFYNERGRVEEPETRASLNAGYVVGALIVAAATGLALLLGADFGVGAALVGAAAAAVIANGMFEFSGALLRARFRNNAYAGLVLAKNGLAFAGMIGAAYLFHAPAAVMAMLAVSAFAATLLLRGETADPGTRPRQARRTQFDLYLRYGGPVVLANICYQGINLANRSVAASHLDFAAAGQLSLATDTTIRLLLVAGAALDILLFQRAVYKRTHEGVERGQSEVARNFLIIAALLGLACCGYMADLPAFAALAAPAKFRAEFAPLSFIMAPGVLLYCLGQFGLNPIAQLEGRTTTILFVAIATAAIDLTLVSLAPRHLGISGYAMLHSASLSAGFFLMLAQTIRWRAYWPKARDIGVILLALCLASAAMWPLRDLHPPLLALVLVALVGLAVYGAVLFLFDLGGFVRPACAEFWLLLRPLLPGPGAQKLYKGGKT